MINALLLTAWAKHADGFIAELAKHKIQVTRVEGLRFRGPLTEYRAVVLLDNATTEAERGYFKKAAHAAGVALITLPAEKARWGRLIAEHHLTDEEIEIVYVNPLPEKPAPETHTAPEAEPAPAPAPAPMLFGDWLRSSRGNTSQKDAAAVLGISAGHLCNLEYDRAPLSPSLLAKIHDLYGKPPAHVGSPRIGAEQRPPSLTLPVAAPVEVVPPPVPAAPEKPANGHHVVAPASSLTGLRRAARALGMTDEMVVRVGDDTTTIQIGVHAWSGADPDAAIAVARRDLDARLRQARARLEEQLQQTRAALDAIGGAL